MNAEFKERRRRLDQSRGRHQSLPANPGVPPARATKPDWVKPAPFGVPDQATRPPEAVPRYPYSDEELQSEIDRKFALYVTLKPGWDTFSAEPVNMDSLADARKFLDLRPDRIPLPFAQINSDGIVGLYWETDEVHVSVDFDGSGLLGYYTWQAVPGGTPVELLKDDVPFPGHWPDQLVEVLWELRR